MRFALFAAFAACLAQSSARAAGDVVAPVSPPLTAEARGLAFVQANCARCHAVARKDESPYPPAPPLRSLTARYDVDGLAEAFAEGIEVGHRGDQDMPVFQLTPAEIDDLLAYLKWIGD